MSRRGSVWQEGRKRGEPAIKGAPWYYVVDLTPPGGKRRQVRKRGFKTRDAAQSALDELLENARNGTAVEPSRDTFGAYLERWLTGLAARGLRPTTSHDYEVKLRAYVLGTPLADVRLQAVTADDLDALYSSMLTGGKRDGSPLSHRTVRYLHSIIRTALGDAERLRRISANPARLASPPSSSSARAPEQATWTPQQLHTFLDRVAGHHHGMLIRLGAMTGLRRGELCGLRWADVDLDAKRLTVRQTTTTAGTTVVHGEGKTKRSRRTVDVDDATIAALREHRKVQLEQRMLVGAGYRDSGLVFAMPDGRGWNPNTISQAFDRLVAANDDLPRVRLHDLRHTHATHLLATGTNVKVVSERLGHASVAFTLDCYGHTLPGQQSDAAAAVAALVGSS